MVGTKTLNTIGRLAFCAAMAAGIGAMAVSAEETAAPGATHPATMTVTGTIDTVDSSQNIVQVKVGASAAQQFKLDPSVKITDGSQMLTPDMLKAGQKVLVEYEERAGARIARSISLMKG